MHHLYPLGKGDPLCHLGFHPQVRWPTRCKRCFRDYKEHGGKRREEPVSLRRNEATASTPTLSTWGAANDTTRSWSSSNNLAFDRDNKNSNSSQESDFSNPSSWESTPDLSNLNDDTQANIPTVNIKLPKRKQKTIDTGQRTVSDSFAIKQDKSSVFNKNDSLAARAKKMQAFKDNQDKSKRIHIKEIKSISEEPTNNDVQFLIQVKKAPVRRDSKENLDFDDDTISTSGTETTDTTLVDHNEYADQIESLKKELDATKAKCERLEKEKSNILLRRLTAMETSSSSKNSATEVLKLQQRCNELQSNMDDYKDEKKILSLKVKELEEELETRPTAQQAQKIADELRSKLLAAESLCEELMDENEDMKKELRDLEEEIEEMHDDFRDGRANEYTSLKKELEQTTKNCRILSFKLRKTDRKVEQLETEKNEAEKKLQEVSGGQTALSYIEKIKTLEKELNTANEKILDLQKLIDEKPKPELTTKKKAPKLASIGRFSSDSKISRESLTRGGSQEDPAQLLRDLQDSLEREADLREQLKFAEEEAPRKRHIYPVELPMYRKPTPLILFNHCELVKSPSLEINGNETNKAKINSSDKTCQTDVHLINSVTKICVKLSDQITQTENVDSFFQTEFKPSEIFTENRADLNSNIINNKITQTTFDLMENDKCNPPLGQIDPDDIQNPERNQSNSCNATDTEPKIPYNIPSFLSSLQRYQLTTSVYFPTRIFSPMATLLTPIGRKLSPTNNRLSVDTSIDKDEGISDDEDIADLKLQLELSEQEAAVLRKKVEELEGENDRVKKKSKELQDKLNTKTSKKNIFSNDKEKYEEKIKTLEEEIRNIRRSLLDKERECDRLNSEINLSKKRSNEMQKAKSLDLDQQTLDLKRQLQVIEQEAAVFRTRVQNLENENEKLILENKKLQLVRNTKTLKADKIMDKYIDQIATLEVELNEANNKLKELENKLKIVENERDNIANTLTKLKQDSFKAFKDRVSKKPTDLTTKAQLKNMVNDLESEIGEILVVLNNSESSKIKIEKELQQLKSNSSNKTEVENYLKQLEETKKRMTVIEKDLKNEKASLTKEKTISEELNKKLTINKDVLHTITEENDKLKIEIDKYKINYDKLLDEKKKVDGEINKLKSELGTAVSNSENTKKMKLEIDRKEKELSKVKNQLEEKNKELVLKSNKLSDTKIQLQDIEEKLQKSEKAKKLEIKQLESKLEEERDKNQLKDSEQLELSHRWKDECKNLNKNIEELNNNILSLESTVKSKNMLIKQYEDSLEKERTLKNNTETKEIKDLREELNKTKTECTDLKTKLETTQKNKNSLEEKLKHLENEFKNDKLKLEKSITDLETNLQNERKKLDVLKSNYEKEHKNRELELGILRNKIKSLEMNSGVGNKKIAAIKQEYQDKIDKLEVSLTSEKKVYADLTAKYEILEEEHVVTKAKLVTEKETLNNRFLSTKKEMEVLEKELQTLRDTYNSKHDTWIKEKLQIQEKLKEYEKLSHGSNDLEKVRLKSTLSETQIELDQIKKEFEVINDQMEYLRRENDELKKKLDDFDKVAKIQRNISADSSAMDKEIRELKTKIINAEKCKKSDLADYKLRYENQIHVINDEIRSLQSQVTRFKRERDTYKHMLEGAQKTIGDLKNSPLKSGRESRTSTTSLDEIEEYRNKIAALEQQVSCMEDELSEARLEGSKLKTELVSERSTYEVKLSELNSRVNELEEEKILSSGRTKIAGLRTRMELAWQKEREEQQRLLQETATLARDLRQTLYEVERERDKERLESRRKLEHLKKSTEDEQEETKRKLTELQCDLLELRDAHAKLRTTNEKLRREKERNEKQREEMKNLINGRRRTEQEDDKRLSMLIEQVESLMQIAPELCSTRDQETSPYTPTPPRRMKGPKSRESSPALERSSKETSLVRDDRQTQFRTTLQRLVEAADDLRKFQKLSEEERERERIKRVMGMRRATSTEHDNGDAVKKTRGITRNGSTGSSLHRKSLSLEQTSVLHEQNIWKGDSDSVSSMQSLDFTSDVEGRYHKRDVSLDSRLSGGSTQSEATGQEKKKKKGLMGKLKQLTKSRSIDDQDPGHFSSTEGLTSKPSSNSDINDETKGSKRDLKERFTGMFKRRGSSSRSNSLERQSKQKDNTSSTQRPLMRNGSNSNISPTKSEKKSK